jgi:UDP-glucose 4-epimerase
MDKITVVTGGCGFIGHHLVNRLVDIGKTVVVFDNLSTGKKERLPEGVKLYKLDLTIDELPNLENVDAIYHLAATTSVEESLQNPAKYKNHILNATRRLLLWAKDMNARRVVMASTAAVYGDPSIIPTHEGVPVNPISPYAEYKWRAENHLAHCHGKGLTTSCLRFFNVFGEGQPTSGSYAPAVARFMAQYENFEPITVTGDGSQTRDYIYVKDIVAALIIAMTRDNFFILNLGSGEELTILEIAESFGGEITHIPARKEPYQSCADIKMASIELGWTPTKNIIKWIHENK